jgi:hypothetical protein
MTLLADLDAFLQEHRRCGELESAVEGESRVDDVHVRRGRQPVGRRRVTRAARLLVRVAVLVRVPAFG